jgi:hypothetical protein
MLTRQLAVKAAIFNLLMVGVVGELNITALHCTD